MVLISLINILTTCNVVNIGYLYNFLDYYQYNIFIKSYVLILHQST